MNSRQFGEHLQRHAGQADRVGVRELRHQLHRQTEGLRDQRADDCRQRSQRKVRQAHAQEGLQDRRQVRQAQEEGGRQGRFPLKPQNHRQEPVRHGRGKSIFTYSSLSFYFRSKANKKRPLGQSKSMFYLLTILILYNVSSRNILHLI